MNHIFGGVGVMALYSRTMFYGSGLSYVGFTAAAVYSNYVAPASAYPTNQSAAELQVCLESEQTLTFLTTWTLIVNALALVSGTAFYYFEKGEPVAVIGMLFYLLNFFSMITLLIWSQCVIFSDTVSGCKS